jgi:DNA-binding ferritin-like protein
MLTNLYDENLKIIDTLRKIFNIADQVNEQGLANYIGGRLEIHKKHSWMLKSTMPNKGVSETKVYELNVKG